MALHYVWSLLSLTTFAFLSVVMIKKKRTYVTKDDMNSGLFFLTSKTAYYSPDACHLKKEYNDSEKRTQWHTCS